MSLTKEEIRLVEELRILNPASSLPVSEPESTGARAADRITRIVGSWRFLIIQSCILLLWVALNVTAYVERWDPYPFILLNLMLSFQAAYTAPVILMSQNREAETDRQRLDYYYNVNLKQELEIELLHQKIDKLTTMMSSRPDKDATERPL